MFLQTPLHLLTGLKTQFRVFPRTNCTLLLDLSVSLATRSPGSQVTHFSYCWLPFRLFTSPLMPYPPSNHKILKPQDPCRAHCALWIHSPLAVLLYPQPPLWMFLPPGALPRALLPATLPDGSNVSPSSSGPRDGVHVLLDPQLPPYHSPLLKPWAFSLKQSPIACHHSPTAPAHFGFL